MGKVSTVKMRDLKYICQPVMDYLETFYDPHCTVIITDSGCKLVRDEISIPHREER